jgi:hypothetical protein
VDERGTPCGVDLAPTISATHRSRSPLAEGGALQVATHTSELGEACEFGFWSDIWFSL